MDCQKDKKRDYGKMKSVPDSVIESMARCLLPKIQAFYESDEGKKMFEEWLVQQEANH